MINTDMKILELLLPAGTKDKDLSPKTAARIDVLQQRMNKYVDKISDPATSAKGKEFLKAKLKQDYDELKSALEEHIVKHGSGYRLLSHKGKNLGDFSSKKAAAKHEGEVEYFKSHPKESEGDTEGLPHLTKELLSHIVQQIGTEGAHAIVKSLEWGDGAAKEFLQLIKKDLENNLSMEESVKQRLDKSCWSGYHKAGTKIKGGVRVNNCVPNESVETPPAEPIPAPESVKYEVVDTRTGKIVGGPYNTRSRARSRADRLDNEYGAYRYKVRKVGSTLFNQPLSESVNKLPLTEQDFELVKQLMNHPIPAIVAPIYIQEILDDDEFNSMLEEWAESKPSMDVRPQIVEWFRRVMPDQMYRFLHNEPTMKQKMGQTSVIHGYDPHMYHGSSEPITGNAYGRY